MIGCVLRSGHPGADTPRAGVRHHPAWRALAAGLLVTAATGAAGAPAEPAPPAPVTAAPPAPVIMEAPAQLENAAAAATGPSFFIEAFDVAGNTLLDALTVDKSVMPYAGPDRTVTDIEAARLALETAYKARGFDSVVVQAIELPDEYAIVRLQVAETRVGTVTVTGAKFASPAVVRRQLAELEPGTVPDFRVVQSQITEANRHFSNREVTVLPRVGAAPGTIDVEAKVKDSLPIAASVTLSNDHNRDTAPLRLNAGIAYNDLWRLGHRIEIGYGVAPENPENSQVFSAGYTAPILGSPWSLSVSGVKSDSNLALSLGSQNVIGNGYTIGGRAEYQVPARGSLFQVLRFGGDYKNYEQDISTVIADEVNIVQPSNQWFTLVADYIVQRSNDRSTSSFSIGLVAGINALSQQLIEVPNPEAFRPGAPPTILVPAFQFTRFDARGNFFKVVGEATHSQSLFSDFLLVGRLQGQLTDTPLLPNEQIAIGGLFTVRGYLVGEAVGDNGINGTLELRSPSAATWLGDFVDEARLYIFADAGYVRTLRALPEQDFEATLVSVGVGSRIQMLRHLSGDVVAAFPLLDGDVSKAGDARISFSVKVAF